jgi:alkylated DNA repair dioxygenase AlkB
MAERAPFQASLFASAVAEEPSCDPSFAGVRRLALDATAWVDVLPGWLRGADGLMAELVASRRWGQRTRHIYDQEVIEPRLTDRWTEDSGEPLAPAVLEAMRAALSQRYGVTFDSLGFNLYRDGRDSVAWHRDKIRKEVVDPVVPLVSLGEPRRLLFRPFGGGPSRAFPLGHGDLLVTGGSAQRTWEHAILKVARAGARISLAFRYGLDAGQARVARRGGGSREYV